MDLENFTTYDEKLWLFPDMLQGTTKRFLFKSYEFLKNKKGEDWLVWHIEDAEGNQFKLSHYTIFCKGRKIPAKEIYLHTWNLTQDMNNKSKFYILEELEKVISLKV